LTSSRTKVSPSNCLLLTLMRLRLNLRMEDVSYRFDIPIYSS
ncbi:transposase family protein, partial [Salmonella enterica subsp. enterica serovar Kentucky]